MDGAVTLKCYEPAGRVISLALGDLLRHVLALGSTGSGKTSAIVNPLLEQLLQWQAADPAQRLGLLILDPKGDETPQKVLAFARAAGREQDVVVLSPQGDSYYDFFGGLSRLDQVEEFTTRLLCGSREMGAWNAYWTESRQGYVETSLVLLLSSGKPLTFEAGIEFIRSLWFAGNVTDVEADLRLVRQLVDAGKLPAVVQRRLLLALEEVKNWRVMDHRTKELHKSTLHNALRPLLSPTGRAFFDEAKPKRFDVRAVLEGKVLVASGNAVAQPRLTSLLFHLLKQDFFSAVHSRRSVQPGEGRLCGLFLDEYPLCAELSDVEKLATSRSKGGFVAACVQSLGGLDEALGRRGRDAVLANFCSLFFFQAREDAMDEFAAKALGYREVEDSDMEYGNLLLSSPHPRRRQLICPAGSLARLGEHQCYVKLADGSVTESPVWLAPTFPGITIPTVVAPKCELVSEVKRLKEKLEDEKLLNLTVTDFLKYMQTKGHSLCLTPDILTAAWQLCTPRRLISVGHKLADLPPCWQVDVTRYLAANKELARAFVGFGVLAGVLWPKLEPCCTWWGDGPLVLPEQLNLAVYPSLWRPLRKKHVVRLQRDRPDLREQLRSLTDAGDDEDWGSG